MEEALDLSSDRILNNNNNNTKLKYDKGIVEMFHAMKAYQGSEDTAPRILYHGIRR